MRVLVVGGSGFIGGTIVRRLAAAGLQPIVASRRPMPGGIVCDATDATAVAEALGGADAAVNAVLGDGRTLRCAARTLAQGAARRGIPLIHLSSAAVYGPAVGRVTESAPLLAVGAYAAAKRDAEAIVRASGARACILRPGIVYGPGSAAWVLRLGRMLRAGRLGDLGPAGDGRCNLVLADDLAGAALVVLRREAGLRETLNLGMADPPRWNDFLARLAVSIGAVPMHRIGRAWLAVETAAAPLLHAGRRLRLPPPISPALQRLFRQEIILDTGRAAAHGFPETPLAAGLAASAAWFRQVAA